MHTVVNCSPFYKQCWARAPFFYSHHRGVFSAKIAPPRHISGEKSHSINKYSNWAVFLKKFSPKLVYFCKCTCTCNMLNCLATVSFSLLKVRYFNRQRSSNLLTFYAKCGSKMARKWGELAPFFSHHCHRTIFFYFSATATCATFFSPL